MAAKVKGQGHKTQSHLEAFVNVCMQEYRV